MLDTLVTKLDADRETSWMIGDSAGDVEAGRAARLRTGLVFAPNRCELCPIRSPARLTPDAHGATVLDLAREILRRS